MWAMHEMGGESIPLYPTTSIHLLDSELRFDFSSVMKKLHEISFLSTNDAFHVVCFVLSNMLSQMVQKRVYFPQTNFWLHANMFTCFHC